MEMCHLQRTHREFRVSEPTAFPQSQFVSMDSFQLLSHLIRHLWSDGADSHATAKSFLHLLDVVSGKYQLLHLLACKPRVLSYSDKDVSSATSKNPRRVSSHLLPKRKL